MSLWLVICLIIVSAFIVMVTFKIINAPIDTKESHSKLIYISLYDCLVDNGYLNFFVFEENFDLEKTCAVNLSVLARNEKGYVGIILNNSNGENLKDLRFGQISLIGDCNLGANLRYPNLLCFSNKKVVNYYNSSSGKQESFILQINIGMKNLGERKI